jgi:hypothetical protein
LNILIGAQELLPGITFTKFSGVTACYPECHRLIEVNMAGDLLEVAIGEVGIRTPLGVARTPAELIDLLQAHQIRAVKLRRTTGSGYEMIGQLIFGLSRIGIEVEV